MPLKPGNEKKPSIPVGISYRPADSVPHLVSDGENWGSVAQRYQVTAQQLIFSNFKTNVPQEINWYLREYVNCNTPTPDGYNWRFSTSARKGSSPRAGAIYVVPNWNAISQAAKQATKEWVKMWFQSVQLQNGQIVNTNLQILSGNLHSTLDYQAVFQIHLRNAGAPDLLAKEWANVLHVCLRDFTYTLTGNHPNAFPLLQALAQQPQYPVPPPIPAHLDATPWHLLMNSQTADGLVEAPYFDQIIYRAQLSGPTATSAIKNYASWFQQSFKMMRGAVKAYPVRGTGFMNMGGIIRGMAWASPGFLQGAELHG